MIAQLWCMWRPAGALPFRLKLLVVADDRVLECCVEVEVAFRVPFFSFP